MADATLIDMTATALLAALEAGEVAPRDLIEALEARIAEVDGAVNALPTLCFERAHADAARLAALPAERRGPLMGLPVPIKDLTPVAGVRTTSGSTIFADHVPTVSDVVVERIEARGGLVYAKSNTPEFGAGANTFNDVFGATRNPYDLAMSAAGSSGGAAAALASGTAWLAHGSDLGGSLRNPASFCNVVGLRPTPGRVPQARVGRLDDTLGVQGPMARTVEDLALFLDALCGSDPRDPISKPAPATGFRAAVRDRRPPARVAWSRDLGVTPVDPEVAAVAGAAARRFAEAGVVVEEATPDLHDLAETFQVLRAYAYAAGMGPMLRDHRDALKPEIVWNIEKGLALDLDALVAAEHARAALAARVAAFFTRYDLLLCPATIVAPFPVEERWPTSCDGTAFTTYVDWLVIAAAATLAGCPALSLPAGFSRAGLPIGLQVIAPANGEAALLAGAAVLEEVLALGTARPIAPRAHALRRAQTM